MMRAWWRFLVLAVVTVAAAASVHSATRVWSQTEGVWSTNPSDTPFTGRSFQDGDTVIFMDPENLSLEQIKSYVTVSGVVIPDVITFTNAVTMYVATNSLAEGASSAMIGSTDLMGRVNFINKYGLAPVTVNTPICYNNVLVADGELTLNNMYTRAHMVTVQPGATLNFRYVGNEVNQRVFAVYNLASGAVWHRLGVSQFINLHMPPQNPTEASTFAPGSRSIFDTLIVSGYMRVSDGVNIEVSEKMDINRLEIWNDALFLATGRDMPSETNVVKTLDVMNGGTLQLLHGNFRADSLATNSEVMVNASSSAAAHGRLIVGGDLEDQIPTCFNYTSEPGIVYTDHILQGNTEAQIPGVTVGGDPGVDSFLFVTNGAKLTVDGALRTGGGDSTDRVRRVFVGDGAEMTVDGRLDFSELTNYAGRADARVVVSNATLRLGGIKFGPKDLENKIRQVIVKNGATLELGADNVGTNIAGVGTGELSDSYAGTQDSHRSLILDGATIKFTADQTLNQTIFMQEAKTNVLDLAGHTVTNTASVNPYYAGNSSGVNSEDGYTMTRFEVRDSSPEQNGFLYIDSPHWSVRNGVPDKKTRPSGYIRKRYGTQLMSGRLRMNPKDSTVGGDCGFSLHGGILELPVGTDYPLYIKESYEKLCEASTALACIWDSEVGAIIRCYCSDKTKLVPREAINQWQLVCEVVSTNKNSYKDGIAIDKFLRETAFQLIDESTGEMLPGATFAAWPLRRHYADSRYETNPGLDAGWWYDSSNPDQVNRYAILMRYEPDIAENDNLYWVGKSGVQTLSDDTPEDWLTEDGNQHRYGDGANVYITNVNERLKLTLSRSTMLKIEEIAMGPDGVTPLVQNNLVVTNLHSSGYEGQKPASPKTLNVFDSRDVYLNAHDTVIATAGVCVSNSVVEIDGYLIVDGLIEVWGDGAWLTATQLVHRSSWFVDRGATFHAGYMDPNVWFSTMSHTITNYGKVTYNLNGRTENITQPLTYPEDATDEDTCYYTFENGTLEFYGMDYLTRRANTNVWISENCVRHIADTAGRAVQSAQSYSPLGYQKGGKLLIDTPYVSRRGSVLRSRASFELHDTLTYVPGASLAVVAHQDRWEGECVIGGTGALEFADNYEGVSFAEQPFRVTVEPGETNRVAVSMHGQVNMVADGGGTLFLAGKTLTGEEILSTVSGTLTVKAGTKLVVDGPQSLGALNVIVEPGATIIFTQSGRPQRLCKSITMQAGSTIGLGPTSSYIEPRNPIRILEVGKLYMPGRGVDALTRFDYSDLSQEDHYDTHGVTNIEDAVQGELRSYVYARSFQSQYVELFGILKELVWDKTYEALTGKTWFAMPHSSYPVDPESWWHEAKNADPTSGDYSDEMHNFHKSCSNAVTFITGAEVTVRPKEGDTDPNTLYPSGITFAAKDGKTTHIIDGGDAYIGSSVIRTAILSTGGSSATLDVPVWLRNLTVERNSTFRAPFLMNEPGEYSSDPDDLAALSSGKTLVEAGSRLQFGAKVDNFVWHIVKFVGEGRVDKIGPRRVRFNLNGEAVFPNHIGIGEGMLDAYGDQNPTYFTGGLTYFRDEGASAGLRRLNSSTANAGWVYDGREKPYEVNVLEDAELMGKTFGMLGRVNVNIAEGKTYHINTHLREYNGYCRAHVEGGTIRFNMVPGQTGKYDVTSMLDAEFMADNRAEMFSRWLYFRNCLFDGGILAVSVANKEREEGIPNSLRTVFDYLGRVEFPGYTDESGEVLRDFPMPVWVAGISEMPDAVMAFNAEGEEIPCEIDSLTDKGLLVWVSVPELVKGTHVYVGIPPEAERKTIPSEEVWKDYVAVWHMNVDNNGKMKDSTTNGWVANYINRSGLVWNTANMEKWRGTDGHLGNNFYFNMRYGSSTYNNGFWVTNSLIKTISELSADERARIVTEGFFTVEKDEGVASSKPWAQTLSYQKIISYRTPDADYWNGYGFAWYSLQGASADEPGALRGTYIAFRNENGENSQLKDDEKITTNTPVLGEWFFAGATLTGDTQERYTLGAKSKSGVSSAMADLMTLGKNGGVPVTSGRVGTDILDSREVQLGSISNQVGIGTRLDDSQAGQVWRGRMDEIRIRKGPAVTALWTETVKRSALEAGFATVTEVTPERRDVIHIGQTLRFAHGSVIEIDEMCTDERSLLLDLTASDNKDKFVTASADASITLDITSFGELTDDRNGATLLTILGDVDVNIFTFKLAMDDVNEEEKWALRSAVRVGDDDVRVTEIQLVKAQGAVMVVSPAASGAVWPETVEPTREFAVDGTDFAVIPHNYNAGRDLRKGAVLRDTYPGHTDGVTTEQVNGDLTTPVNPNTAYWFWFEGGNGAWSDSKVYTLNLKDDPLIPEDDSCYVQFAVTNQIFYGQAMDTLNAGELGFYVSWGRNAETGLDETNLVARVLNTSSKVTFPLGDISDPWLIVTVRVRPSAGYDISFHGVTKTLDTAFADHPKQLRITGVAPVDNIYVSCGDPDRDRLVYVHDMTVVGHNEDGSARWADAPLNASEEYLNEITKQAKDAEFDVEPPTLDHPEVKTLPVSFQCRKRRGGVVLDSEKPNSTMDGETGSDHLERIELLGLPLHIQTETIPAHSTSLDKDLNVYKFEYEYALGIKRVKRYENNAVSIFSVLSSSAEDYNDEHLLGNADKPHLIKGYVLIETTDSITPYAASNAAWRPVCKSEKSQFGSDHENEIFVDEVDLKSNRTYRVRIQKALPKIQSSR